MDEGYRTLVGKRKNRTLAIMLSEKEEIVDEYLPSDVSHELRKLILDHVNDFHDFCIDIMESMDAGTVTNQLALEKLNLIYEAFADN